MCGGFRDCCRLYSRHFACCLWFVLVCFLAGLCYEFVRFGLDLCCGCFGWVWWFGFWVDLVSGEFLIMVWYAVFVLICLVWWLVVAVVLLFGWLLASFGLRLRLVALSGLRWVVCI